ncbi:MAG TPA: hypothetical protein VGK17_22230 [Propionicimonas sp.]
MTGLLRRWMLWVTAAEFVGFVTPAVVGAVTLVDEKPWAYLAMIAAGAVEGTVLGWAQMRVLRRAILGMSARRWIVATAVGAAIAWSIGMLPSTTYATWSRWPGPLAVGVGLVGALALLCSIGVAQWFELRRHLGRAGRWVAATAAAWGLGLIAFTAVATPLWQEGQSPAVVIAIGALGGLAMAATMALITGLALRRLLAPAPGHERTRRPAKPQRARRAARARRNPAPHTAPSNPRWRHAS